MAAKVCAPKFNTALWCHRPSNGYSTVSSSTLTAATNTIDSWGAYGVTGTHDALKTALKLR